MELSVQHKELSCALSVWLFDQMTNALRDKNGLGNEYYDFGQSNFEYGCAALHILGIFDQAQNSDAWCAVVGRDEIPQHLQDNLPNQRALRELMLGFAHQFGFVSDQGTLTGPFRVAYPELLKVCEKLADCGYMQKIDNRTFDWDDSFGPWMVHAGNWALDDFEPSSEAEIEKIVSAIPVNDREYLAGPIGGRHSMFARWFCGHWNGETWISGTKDLDPDDDWDLSLAAGVYRRLNGDAHE